MHRFIIVGGGAGGLELATRLGDKFGNAGAIDFAARDLICAVPSSYCMISRAKTLS